MADRRDIRSRTTQRNPSHTDMSTHRSRMADTPNDRNARRTEGAGHSSGRYSYKTSQHSAARTSTRGTAAGRAAQRSLRRSSREAMLQDVPEVGKTAGKVKPEPEEMRPVPEDAQEQPQEQPELVSTSVGEIRRQERAKRLKRSSRRYLMKFIVAIGVIVALVAGWAALYNSPAFSISSVQVNGVEHLTSDEMTQLAAVPSDTTLLRVDTDTIAARVKQSSWVKDVQINRVFPSTLEINVTERPVLAVVEMPNKSGTSTKRWAIADDRMWLMPIPDEDTEAAQTTSAKIYEDANNVVQIVDLPYGTGAQIGQICEDDTVNNALSILQEMTTELSGQVVKISAASIAETSLYLENGVEIAFGSAEDIRDKERTILKIMEEHPDGVTYINVRIVENPTWRSL